MYKISDKVINFIINAMENWRVELLAVVKIRKGIFHKESLSLLLFVTAMRPFDYVNKKCIMGRGNKFSKSPEMINHLMYIDDIKVFVKNKKKNLRPNTNIQPGHLNGISMWKFCHAHRELLAKRNTYPGKNEDAWRKRKFLRQSNIGSGHHQKRDYPRRARKFLKNKLQGRYLI